MYSNDVFDLEAYKTASKALFIIFIILILLANGLLIFKYAGKGDFMYKTQNLTIVSLAIGDVILALFPMIVQTKYFFGDYILTGISCSTVISELVYTPHLITFVYGIGLIMLGADINTSHTNSLTTKSSQIVYSLAYSSFPWILGLIVILPLGIANVDVNTCQSSQTIGQGRALLVIAIILPACGALVTSVLVKNRKSPAANSPAQDSFASISQSTAFTTQPPNPEGVIPVNPRESHAPPPTYRTTQGQYPNYPHPPLQFHNQSPLPLPQRYNQPQQQGPPQFYNQPQHQGPPQFYNQPQQERPPQFYNQPQQQQQPQFYNQPQHLPYYTPGQSQLGNPTYYPGIVNVSTTQTNSLITSNAIPNINRLVAISMVNFFLVIPLAIFHLSYLPLNTDAAVLTPVLIITISDFVLWLNILRSVITPLMMYGYSDN